MEQGLAENSRRAYRSDLTHLARWLTARGSALARAAEEDLRAYLGARVRGDGGARLGPRSQARLITALRRFFAFLVRERERADDPAAHHAGTVSPARPHPCLPREPVIMRNFPTRPSGRAPPQQRTHATRRRRSA